MEVDDDVNNLCDVSNKGTPYQCKFKHESLGRIRIGSRILQTCFLKNKECHVASKPLWDPTIIIQD